MRAAAALPLTTLYSELLASIAVLMASTSEKRKAIQAQDHGSHGIKVVDVIPITHERQKQEIATRLWLADVRDKKATRQQVASLFNGLGNAEEELSVLVVEQLKRGVLIHNSDTLVSYLIFTVRKHTHWWAATFGLREATVITVRH
jgi:hypothetical protein